MSNTLTTQQVADMFHMSPRKIGDLVERGKLRAAQDGTFTEDAVRQFINDHTFTPSR